jgi:hypothetical protein
LLICSCSSLPQLSFYCRVRDVPSECLAFWLWLSAKFRLHPRLGQRVPVSQEKTLPTMSGAGALPPLFVITSSDHGGYVCVALYTLLILMVVTVVARLFTRWYIIRLINADDILLALAMVRTFKLNYLPTLNLKLRIAGIGNTTKRIRTISSQSWPGKKGSYCIGQRFRFV